MVELLCIRYLPAESDIDGLIASDTLEFDAMGHPLDTCPIERLSLLEELMGWSIYLLLEQLPTDLDSWFIGVMFSFSEKKVNIKASSKKLRYDINK